MIRTQISFEEELYREAKRAAKAQKVSLSELCRRGLRQVLGREARDDKNAPWMRFAGVVDAGPGASESVDEVVYGRDEP
jgi:hypothetical protein